MNSPRRTHDLALDIREEEIWRLLGYGDRPTPARVAQLIREVREECTPLLSPACAVLRQSGDDLYRSEYLRGVEDVVLCLVTVGGGVEQVAARYDQADQVAKALVASTFGSVATEAAADTANALIRADIEREGLRCSRRFSPGYGGWDVAEQRWILSVLEGDALGVALTDGCMMVPRKSVTFAVNVGVDPVEMRDDNACDSCDLVNCRYRRDAVVSVKKGREWTTFIARHSNYCPRDKWS